MDTTSQLALPLLQASQAQKHITHNEALLALDGLVQLRLLGDGSGEPPLQTGDGEVYWTGSTPSGAWTGQPLRLARNSAGAWIFIEAKPGWIAWREADERICQFDGAAWQPMSLLTEPMLGINATPDPVNRLILKSEAALFDHDGGSVQVKLNSSGTGSISSLLFQRDYVGHGEWTLDDDLKLTLRHSGDGAAWRNKIVVARYGPESVTIFVSKDAGANFGAQISSMADGTASDQWAGLSFYPTFGSFPSDTKPRRCGDIVCGFDGVWGTQFLLFCVGDANANDDGRLTDEIMRLTNGAVDPGHDNGITLGSAGARWSEIYCASGVIATSDAREKCDLAMLDDRAAAFVLALEPISYRWKQAGYQTRETGETDASGWPVRQREPREGLRSHAGFSAQSVKSALDAVGLDLALWGIEDPSND
ncbi:MAG: DUF2793 domain-containing protein, partial [Pseudomonadota bacterium]